MKGAARCDVAVVGGGPAGVAAALAAAGAGAATVLIERESRLGGNVAQALVHTICGLYHADAATPVPAHPGLPSAVADALARAGAAGPPRPAGRVFYLPIRPAGFAALAAHWCETASGLDVRPCTAVVAADLAAGPAADSCLTLRGVDDCTALAARVVVDASGDAVAAFRGGAAVEMAAPDRLQRPSFVFRLDGVSEDALDEHARLALTASVARAARRGVLPAGCESVVVRMADTGSAWATLTLPAHGAPDPPPCHGALAALAARGRAHAEAVVAFLRATRRGFADAAVAEWPTRVGVRETRRIRGRDVVTRDDVLRGRRRADEVAVSTWPIELWEDHRRARFEHPAGACSVPLGALVSRTHPMLGAAGRCMSATHEALGALRVIGTALATGEAIGVAAALAADAGTGLAGVAPHRVRERVERATLP